MLGKLLEESGGAQRIATTLIRVFETRTGLSCISRLK